MRDDTTSSDELTDGTTVDTEQSETGRHLKTADSQVSKRRREVLALASSGAFASLAGCSDLLQAVRRDTPFANTDTPTESGGRTAEEVDVDEDSELNTIIATRKSYSQEPPELSPQPQPQLNAPEVDIKEGEARFVAAPVAEVTADRVVIFHPEGPDPGAQQRIVLTTFGAPTDQAQATTSIDGGRVEFNGGTVDNTEIAAGVATIEALGECVLVARGDGEEALTVALDGFDRFVAERFE